MRAASFTSAMRGCALGLISRGRLSGKAAMPRCRYTPSAPTSRLGPLAVRTTRCCLLLACTLTGFACVPGSRLLPLSSKNRQHRPSSIPRARGARSPLVYRTKRKKMGGALRSPQYGFHSFLGITERSRAPRSSRRFRCRLRRPKWPRSSRSGRTAHWSRCSSRRRSARS